MQGSQTLKSCLLAAVTLSRSEILGIGGSPVCGLTSFRFEKYSKPASVITCMLRNETERKGTKGINMYDKR